MNAPAEPVPEVSPDPSPREGSLNFIEQIIVRDREEGKNDGRVHTRFPPEPNGYLHIGHAKSICLNFGLGKTFGGLCNLRFDDTNPTKEEVEYVDSIQADVRWLGFDWEDRLFFASDYFEQLYTWALELIRAGKAYVCDLTGEEMREYRGTLTEAGRDCPFRDRSVADNLDLFGRMRAGEFPDGTRTLRAKIDMASPNITMRDPVLYRILHAHHHRTGDSWCIYPTYDYAHGQSDAIEGITHSICTLEFENHRPLYNWCLDNLSVPCKPRQIEFARLALSYTMMSKRKLLALVKDGTVSGWDDPRMPTISGLRRRGYTPESIRSFCSSIGVARMTSLVDVALLESSIRDDLNARAPRVLAVLDPLRVVITNYPEGQTEELLAQNHPQDAEQGTRMLHFGREIYIEREDFMEDPPKKFFRLSPGREVRLRYAYFLTCNEVIKDDSGRVTELRGTIDPATRGGDSPDGRKVKGTIHWVSAADSVPIEVRLYEQLFTSPTPDAAAAEGDSKSILNPTSLTVLDSARLEGTWRQAVVAFPDDIVRVQFERHGYFALDSGEYRESSTLIWNRTVTLRDSWAKIAGA